MQCMKCGREAEAERVFCAECLANMEKYPVKPGTVVQLPPRTPQAPAKKQPSHRRKPALPLEEQVKLLRKFSRALAAALVLALAALICMGYLTVKQYLDGQGKPLPGQNYSSITTTEAKETK